jgi:cell division septum initiation protein DivIVA
MRGYDRGQVEDYVTRLQEFLHDAEQRAMHADRRLAQMQRKAADLEREVARATELASTPGAAYDQLGERISTILRLAAEEADSIRTAARNDAEALLEQARREADQARITAEHALSDLSRRRDGVVSELNRVRDILTSLGLSGDHEEGGADAPAAAPQTVAVPAPKGANVVIDLTDRQAARTT